MHKDFLEPDALSQALMSVVNMPKTRVFAALWPFCTTYFSRMLDVPGTRRAVTSIRDCREYAENAVQVPRNHQLPGVTELPEASAPPAVDTRCASTAILQRTENHSGPCPVLKCACSGSYMRVEKRITFLTAKAMRTTLVLYLCSGGTPACLIRLAIKTTGPCSIHGCRSCLTGRLRSPFESPPPPPPPSPLSGSVRSALPMSREGCEYVRHMCILGVEVNPCGHPFPYHNTRKKGIPGATCIMRTYLASMWDTQWRSRRFLSGVVFILGLRPVIIHRACVGPCREGNTLECSLVAESTVPTRDDTCRKVLKLLFRFGGGRGAKVLTGLIVQSLAGSS